MYQLGALLATGAPGVPRDIGASRHWMQRAADAGLPYARDCLLASSVQNGELPSVPIEAFETPEYRDALR